MANLVRNIANYTTNYMQRTYFPQNYFVELTNFLPKLELDSLI